jgi:hypothetical protein
VTEYPPAPTATTTTQPVLLSPPPVSTEAFPSSPLLLESGLACNYLAARTLEGIRPILLHLSPPLLGLFAAAAALKREAEALAEEVQQRAIEAQARLRFQDTSALLHAGGGGGARGRGEGNGHRGGGSLLLLAAESAALPFVEERDARHLYQGAAWSNELFNRQEEARDAFLKLLREFQEEKGQLDGRRVAAFLQALPTRAQDVLALLLPFSVPWFAELFAATLLRVRAYPRIVFPMAGMARERHLAGPLEHLHTCASIFHGMSNTGRPWGGSGDGRRHPLSLAPRRLGLRPRQ